MPHNQNRPKLAAKGGGGRLDGASKSILALLYHSINLSFQVDARTVQS